MIVNPNELYQEARRRQSELEMRVLRERYPQLLPSRPWLDPAIWSVILGPIIGVSFLVYFAHVILSAVRG